MLIMVAKYLAAALAAELIIHGVKKYVQANAGKRRELAETDVPKDSEPEAGRRKGNSARSARVQPVKQTDSKQSRKRKIPELKPS